MLPVVGLCIESAIFVSIFVGGATQVTGLLSKIDQEVIETEGDIF